MIHLQNTQEQIDKQKQHYVELQEDIPDELREKIDKFEIVKGILHVSNTVNEMCKHVFVMCLLQNSINIYNQTGVGAIGYFYQQQ